MEIDPYTLIHDCIVEVLFEESDFACRVKRDNSVSFTGSNRDPVKAEAQSSDLPEFRIIPAGSKPEIVGSNSSKDTQRFALQVASGDQRVDCEHFPIKWAMLKALCREQRLFKRLNALPLPAGVSMGTLSFGEVTEGVSEQDLNRGIKGWSTNWTVSVSFVFAVSRL